MNRCEDSFCFNLKLSTTCQLLLPSPYYQLLVFPCAPSFQLSRSAFNTVFISYHHWLLVLSLKAFPNALSLLCLYALVFCANIGSRFFFVVIENIPPPPLSSPFFLVLYVKLLILLSSLYFSYFRLSDCHGRSLSSSLPWIKCLNFSSFYHVSLFVHRSRKFSLRKQSCDSRI